MKIVGVDIGGTKINVGRVEGNSIAQKYLVKTPALEDESTVLNAIVTAVRKVLTNDVKAIGIGVPGMVDTKNGIVFQVQNIPSWKEVHIKEYLEKEFGIAVFVNNDANCFAAGENRFGKAKDYQNFVGITLGTGLGAGIIIDNSLHNGVGAGAGELGYLPYKDGIFEHYCSSQFFSKFHHTTGLEVYEAIQQGDEKAQEIMDEFGFHLGELIKRACYVLAPEAVVFGGSISKAFKTFEKSMKANISTFPFASVIEGLNVFPSNLDDISVLGAAALYYNH